MNDQRRAPWSDDRFADAFRARSAGHSTPTTLAEQTIGAVRRERSRTRWPSWAPAAAVLLLALTATLGAVVFVGGDRGAFGQVQFREGPTSDLHTLVGGSFAFNYPADWLAYDASAPFSGGSSIAVLGTQPVESRCGDRHVDINCVYEQPLDPGRVRLYVGSGAYRGNTILDRPDIENGSTERTTIGGMPAIIDRYDSQPGSYYREDVELQYSIAFPNLLSNVIDIEIHAREWPNRGRVNTLQEVEDAVRVIVNSFRFVAPPTPLPTGRGAAIDAARQAIATQAEDFRRGWLQSGDTTTRTYLDCLGDEPLTPKQMAVRYSPGGVLIQPVDMSCRWDVATETPSIWRLTLIFDWTAGVETGRFTETRWLDVSASVIGGIDSGDYPPSGVFPTASPSTPAAGLPVTSVADAIAIRDAGVDDREIAVRGWFSPIPPRLAFTCPISLGRVVPPVQLVCPDAFMWITEEPESTVFFREGVSFEPPHGPAVHPSFDQIDPGSLPAMPSARSCGKRVECPVSPFSIVAIGHFDDRRAALCAPKVAEGCRDRFVVDRVDTIDGVDQPLSVVDGVDGNQVWALDDVERIVAERPVLSVNVVDGAEGLPLLEQSLREDTTWLSQRAVWVVRTLVDGHVATDLLIDGSDRVFEMQVDGSVWLVRGSQPASHDAPWPPKGSIVLNRRDGAVELSPLAVVDLSRHAVDAEVSDASQGNQHDLTERTVWVDQLSARRVLVQWGGGQCDQRLLLTIRADNAGSPDSIVIDGRRTGPCRAALAAWAIELTFDRDVDADALMTQYQISPEA